LLVGGHTVWVEEAASPKALVVAHPNRFGGGENLDRLGSLADRYGAEAWVIVDPLLMEMVDLPEDLLNATTWPDGGHLHLAGERALQAAAALRRRLGQVPGLRWPVVRPAGRTVTCLAPIPGQKVQETLADVGILVDAPTTWWEGIVTLTVGWWHTRVQLDGLAAAVAEMLAGRSPAPLPPDSFEAIPDDLPRRHLNRIKEHLRGG
ncbi:MAG TPA: hypothetical protein VM470_01885, partial [Acidimicrobiia bacterium]|nr:hypothetical protein [Acidimicrobiia bacterium]